MKHVFHAKTKFIDFYDGTELTIWLNEGQAVEYGITAVDKVSLVYEGKEYVLDAKLTNKYVDAYEVGLPKDVVEKYKIKKDKTVQINFTQTSSVALDALKRVMKGKRATQFTQKEIEAIMKDISTNRFTDTLITYFSALGFFHDSSDQEMYWMAKAMAEAGEMLHFK